MGNRRADSIVNIIENGNIGALFLLPGYEETLRVNGRAVVTEDSSVLGGLTTGLGRPAELGIGIIVEECFLHCAKASIRSSLWNPLFWPDLVGFPTAAAIFREHAGGDGAGGSLQEMEALLQEGYTKRL
jgi:predicted pyridoxine 5'-phosphate oxidase superfamily flavin-nucleotide-binding protein